MGVCLRSKYSAGVCPVQALDCYFPKETVILEGEYVAIRNDDWAAINKAIAEAIAPLRPRGWRKALHLLREWSVLGVTATIIVALLTLAAAAFYQATARIEKETKFQVETTTTLGQIDKTLAGLQTSISFLQAQIAASKYSAISKKELKSYKTELQNIKANLAKTPKDIPNFWPTSFQIITLLSQAMWQLETIGTKPLSIYDNFAIRGGAPALISGINVLLKNQIEGLSLENSVIHFDPSVKLVNVSFRNCVFIFPAETQPSQPLQRIGEALLASDLTNVKIGQS